MLRATFADSPDAAQRPVPTKCVKTTTNVGENKEKERNK